MPSLKSFPFATILILASSSILTTALQAGSSAFTVFNSTGRLPNGCIDDYSAARDEVLYTVPYTYPQVLSIIGSFANITWNGNNATTLNGTDNTVGTARSYEYLGIPLTQTIKTYQKPVNGPYFEDHTIAPSYNPATNISLYASTDALTATPVCGDTAVALNFTVDFCSTDVSAAGEIFRSLHLLHARILQEFLGNETWNGCEDFYGGGATPLNGTSLGGGGYYGTGPTATPIAFTGGATTPCFGLGAVVTAVAASIL